MNCLQHKKQHQLYTYKKTNDNNNTQKKAEEQEKNHNKQQQTKQHQNKQNQKELVIKEESWSNKEELDQMNFHKKRNTKIGPRGKICSSNNKEMPLEIFHSGLCLENATFARKLFYLESSQET